MENIASASQRESTESMENIVSALQGESTETTENSASALQGESTETTENVASASHGESTDTAESPDSESRWEDSKNNENISSMLQGEKEENMDDTASALREGNTETTQNMALALNGEGSGPKCNVSQPNKLKRSFPRRVRKRKRLTHTKYHYRKNVHQVQQVELPIDVADKPYTVQIKTEDFEPSPAQILSPVNIDFIKMERADIKIEDFHSESEMYENSQTVVSSERHMDFISADASLEMSVDAELSDDNGNEDISSRSNLGFVSANYFPGATVNIQSSSKSFNNTDIQNKIHVLNTTVTQLPPGSSPGSYLINPGEGLQVKTVTQVPPSGSSGSYLVNPAEGLRVKTIFFIKSSELPDNFKPQPQEMKDPLEISPLQAVNSLEVRDQPGIRIPLGIPPKPRTINPIEIKNIISPVPDLLKRVKQEVESWLNPPWHALIQQNALHVFLTSLQNNICIQRSLRFSIDGAVEIFVHGNPIETEPYLKTASRSVPLTAATVSDFVDRVKHVAECVRSKQLCRGVDNTELKPVWKLCPTGKIDTNICNDPSYTETFRSLQCLWLVKRMGARCEYCSKLSQALKYRLRSRQILSDISVAASATSERQESTP